MDQLHATATQTDVSLDAPGVKYFYANAAARSYLINDLGWAINDDGMLVMEK